MSYIGKKKKEGGRTEGSKRVPWTDENGWIVTQGPDHFFFFGGGEWWVPFGSSVFASASPCPFSLANSFNAIFSPFISTFWLFFLLANSKLNLENGEMLKANEIERGIYKFHEPLERQDFQIRFVENWKRVCNLLDAVRGGWDELFPWWIFHLPKSRDHC